MAISTNSILHFTRSRSSLKKILNGFFNTYYCLEIFRLNGAEYRLGIPMISFCDIPISHITSHTEKYGNYGIGLSKEWAESNGINPVLYLEEYSSSTRLIEPLIRDVIENDPYGNFRTFLIWETKDNIATPKDIVDRERDLKINAVVGQLSFIKNYKGELKRKGKIGIQYRFYDEREWRYVPVASTMSDDSPLFLPILTKNEYDGQRGISSLKKEFIKGGGLKFDSKDIEYIFVKKESEIPIFIKAIRKSKNIYENSDDLDLLISKFLSVERIKNDF